eukprot:scaffold3902_cov53-Attheya_sp.AAC.1
MCIGPVDEKLLPHRRLCTSQSDSSLQIMFLRTWNSRMDGCINGWMTCVSVWTLFRRPQNVSTVRFVFFCFVLYITAVSPSALNVDVKISVGDGEPIESALRRFKREVNKSGHLMELRHKRYFENTQEKKKRKIVQARNRKRIERMQRRKMSNRT